MQVIETEPGHARCAWRGEVRRVRTALVGDVAAGDWVLVFLDSAQERLDEARAAEIDATLALIAAAAIGQGADADAAFELPSSLSRERLLALSGQHDTTTDPSPSLESTR